MTERCLMCRPVGKRVREVGPKGVDALRLSPSATSSQQIGGCCRQFPSTGGGDSAGPRTPTTPPPPP